MASNDVYSEIVDYINICSEDVQSGPRGICTTKVDSAQEKDNSCEALVRAKQELFPLPTLEPEEMVGIRSAVDTQCMETPARKKLIISKRKKELAGVSGTNFSS